MDLITSYYNSPNTKRQNEINQCLINNIKNLLIGNIFLLNDKHYNIDFINELSNYKKVIEIIIPNKTNERLTFKEAIDITD